MNYSRPQRYLSSLLIFSILFLQTVEIPLLDSTRANAQMNADLISFIVDDDIYSGTIKSRINRYAEDIQAYLPHTRVVIFPVSKVSNPFNIASINEKLYYEGDGEGLSRLIGTILIGEVPLPVVHRDSKSFLSVYPYVDFDNKSFVYDQVKKSYEYTSRVTTEEKPEIWHSVIRPNTGTASDNESKLIAFFDKTHDFYLKQGVFAPENTKSEPRVFYFDALHDQLTSSAENLQSYELFLANIEDIAYNRFNKYLARTLSDTTAGIMNVSDDLIKDPDIRAIINQYSGSVMNLANVPDITTKEIIEKAAKQFFEIFNAKYMGDILRYVHNAGRYGDATNVRVDSTPVVIAKKDILMRQTLKDTNTALESAIDQLVRGAMSNPLRVFTAYEYATKYRSVQNSNTLVYKNYFFGQKAEDVTKSDQCTIVRGGEGTGAIMAEANRGYNVQNAEPDINLLLNDLPKPRCIPGNTPATLSFWGGNSPLSLDMNSMSSGRMVLKPHVYTGFSKSIFDIAGSRELEASSPLHQATPLDCYNKDFLLQPYIERTSDGETIYWPEEKGSALSFSCLTTHKRPIETLRDYKSYMADIQPEACTLKVIELDGSVVKQARGECVVDGPSSSEEDTSDPNVCDEPTVRVCSGGTYKKTYRFKTVSSVMTHKSPTDEEYGKELANLTTPSLPSDRDRYVDFLNKQDVYTKITYPNLFRITLNKEELNYTGALARIRQLLDAKSAEIRTKGGDINLYNLVSSDSKALNALVESVIFHNLDNATRKYASLLEQSLDIDGVSKTSADDRKNDYEIAYLGAPGDAKGMYVKVDPAEKGALSSRLTGINDRMNAYRGIIDGTNVASVDGAPEFKCGPPEGVPIYKWMPAIFCWLGDMLPPTIGAGSCTDSTLGGDTNPPSSDSFSRADANNNGIPDINEDANKNGIIDANEIIATGRLVLDDPEDHTYGYNENILLAARLMKDGKVITVDSFNKVSFDVKKITTYSGGTAARNGRVVYERGASEVLSDINTIAQYINFTPTTIRADKGVAQYRFTAKNSDVDVVMDAHILTKDRKGNVVVDKTSLPITLVIRSDRIAVQSSVRTGTDFVNSTVIEAGNSHGIRFNLQKVSQNQIVTSHNFPYTLRVYDDISNKLLIDPINVTHAEYLFKNALLEKSGVYRAEFTDRRGVRGYTTITVLPASPSRIEIIPASNIFIKDAKTTVLVKVLDTFGNYANAEVLPITASISGGGVLFDDDDREVGNSFSKNIMEGYTSFNLTSHRANENIQLKIRIAKKNLESPLLTLHSIESARISVDVEDKDHIVAGKEKHRITIRVKDSNGNVLSRANGSEGGFNGIVSLDFPKLSGVVEPAFARIVDGVSVGDIFFTPKYVAGKNLSLDAQIPGIDAIDGNTITVLPDVPMSFEFSGGGGKAEAKEGNRVSMRASLSDRYGNIADNTSGYSLSLDIPSKYHRYTTFGSGTGGYMKTVIFSGGVADFDVMTTSLPGKAYIAGKVSPGLEEHSFTVTDKSGQSVTVSGISENITTLRTYYIFNKEKLDRIRYDALYSVLLGGDYGDVTEQEYLGGEILFNANSKSLAVTTLLNNPWRERGLFGFTPAGKYTLVANSDDAEGLKAEISSNQDKSFIAFYDSFHKEYIARAWFNIDPENTAYMPCQSTGSTINDCPLSTDKTTVFMKGLDGTASTLINNELILATPNGTRLVRINSRGKIEKYPGVELELDAKNTANLLGIRVLSNRALVGYIGIKFLSNTIETVPTLALSNSLTDHKNALVIETLSPRYNHQKTYLGISSRGSQGVMFGLRDMTSTDELGEPDDTYSGRQGVVGFEQYPKKAGIGWEEDNRTLLNLAGGGTVGDATKWYQTFSTITLGDAVAHLPKASPDQNFDHTLGREISVGAGEQIESYKKIDFNGDSISDIVIFYESGKIQLLANYQGSFKDMGYLAYVSDAGKERKGVGDFFKDGFGDIALVDKGDRLILIDNIEGKFTRKEPIILSASGNVTTLAGHIQQLEVFDMDHDGYSDLVTVDSAGELNILYGGVRTANGLTEHIFTKKLIDDGLGLRLSAETRNDGGAFYYTGLTYPVQPNISGDTTALSGAVNQGMIDNLVYYRYTYNKQLTGVFDPTVSDMNQYLTASGSEQKVFIRSQFAEGKGLKVEKKYTPLKDTDTNRIESGNRVEVELKLTNTSGRPFADATYLDSNDAKLFKPNESATYILTRNGTGQTLPIKPLVEGEYDYAFDLGSIAVGEVVTIKYKMNVASFSYGKIQVGLLEKGETGDDIYGDISLSPDNMCGGELIMWRSVEPFPRQYRKGTKIFANTSKLPEELQKNTVDADGNGVPDYIDDLIKSGKGDTSLLQEYNKTQLETYNKDTNNNRIPDRSDKKGDPLLSYDQSNKTISIAGLSSANIDAIDSQVDDVIKGLGCGFGGGSCLSMPMNWAPLAPGTAPSIMGYPLTSLKPGTGLPAFSALTGMRIGPYCIPSVWPVSPLDLGKQCSGLGAGGYLGDKGALNFFRLYITPTITGAIGVAACFDSIPSVTGQIPPKGVSPIVPGGNCIVAAKPFFGCKDDGSDGDLGSLGLGFDSSFGLDNSYVNANSCRASSSNSILSSSDRSNLLRYVGGDRSVLPEINASMAAGNIPSSLSAGPLIGIGQGSGGDGNFEASLDVTALKNFDIGNIIKIKNDRVSAFPDFLMDWANRQLEEVVNKLTSLPTLYVIFPDFEGLDLSGYENFVGKLDGAFQKAKGEDANNYAADAQSNSTLQNSTLQGLQGQYNSAISNNGGTINSLGQNVSGVKAAYEFISHLPLVKLENQTVDISVPWMSPEEGDKWLVDAELTLKKYKKEKDDKVQKWTKAGTPAGADSLAIIQSDSLINSLEENIRIIKEYRKFPEKLQKYLTWKERYATQILCNIEAIEMMMGGWIADNGQRFRTWVELYMLIKSILKSWQLIVDLFYDYEAECAVCRNERYDLKQFIFKIVSAIIPKIPIVQFPKWPDIWLDLHNIRAGLPILMPEFHFNFVPIVLPQLPNFFLPDVPTGSLNIPNLPLLPRLPELPSLPDMPSLPLITLPDLPPPPTIPKLLGAIAAVLDIFKLVAKVKCIMNINPFVPEWRAGDQIAQITERQGKSPFDFIDLEYPNFPMSFTDGIKVKTYVNLEFEVEFILEMAQATLGPLNTFTNNVSNLTGSQPTIPNVDFRNTVPDDIDINTEIQGYTPKENPLNSIVRRLSFDLLSNFITLNTYMHRHVGEVASVDVFKDILQGNIATVRSDHDPRTLAITDTLQRAVDYRGDKENALIKDLAAQNTEKFRVLKEYVRGEKAETTRLKTEINEMLRSGKMSENIPSLSTPWSPNIKIAALNNSLVSSTQEVQKQIRANNEKIIPSMRAIASGQGDNEGKEIAETGKKLLANVRTGLDSFSRDMTRNANLHADEYRQSSSQLLALDTAASTSSASTPPTTQSMYSYEYNGIYILDKNGKQTRLFDYTEGVDGTEELLYLDCDGDGDDDIVYRMGNSLYLKENSKTHPNGEHNTSSPEKLSWTSFLGLNNTTSTLAPAPNYFEENFISSNEINFGFTPASGVKDNLFRLEYYDYIDRFDRINAGEQSASIRPKTQIHKVDLVPNLLNETIVDTTISGFIGRKNTVMFGRGTGGGMVTMRKYQILTSRSAPVIIGASRTIYTDAGGATIEYMKEGETEHKTLFLDDNTNYEFLVGATIWVKSGNIYLFNESTEEKLVNLGDLRGMPVLPDTMIELDSASAFISFNYYDGSSMRLDGPGAYEYYSLGEKSNNYHVSMNAANDWYYARLYSFSLDKISTIANLTLLSPQRQADKEGPLITYGDMIRVPVYQKQTISLVQYINDISGVKRVYVDTDLTKDTDGDGNVTNDADSLDPHNTSLIKQGKTIFDLEVGSFDSLFVKKIRLYAEDENGNISSKDLTLVIYAPIPEIESTSGSVISGAINESLIGEPIDIFRFRSGKMTRLKVDTPSTALTVKNGLFSIPTSHLPDIILKRSGSGVANISERTGKIDLLNPLYSLSVVGATNNNPFKIQIKDVTGQEIFSERFSLPSGARLEGVTSFDNITKAGLYILPGNSGISFVRNISTAPTLPGGGYITDSTKRAIAGISVQGDIYILDNTYSLAYDTFGSYVVIRLKNQSGQAVASILYRVDTEYVIR